MSLHCPGFASDTAALVANIVKWSFIPFPRDSNEAEIDFPIVLSAFCEFCCTNCLFSVVLLCRLKTMHHDFFEFMF